jgi:hypothetical protein
MTTSTAPASTDGQRQLDEFFDQLDDMANREVDGWALHLIIHVLLTALLAGVVTVLVGLGLSTFIEAWAIVMLALTIYSAFFLGYFWDKALSLIAWLALAEALRALGLFSNIYAALVVGDVLLEVGSLVFLLGSAQLTHVRVRRARAEF